MIAALGRKIKRLAKCSNFKKIQKHCGRCAAARSADRRASARLGRIRVRIKQPSNGGHAAKAFVAGVYA